MATRISGSGVKKSAVTSGSKAGIVRELHKAARRNYPRRHVTIKGFDDLYMADLLEMRQYARQNAGHNYILCIIDCFTKRGWALPLKTKKGEEVARVLDKFFGSLAKCPKLICTDDGKEFFNSQVSEIFEKYKIKHYSTYSGHKSTIVERFNRTIRNWIEQEFQLVSSFKWIDFIDRILNRYNHRVHRSTGFAPLAINKRNAKKVLKRLSKKGVGRRRKKFRVGDIVRISKFKNLFEKGYTKNWSTELYTVEEVKKTRPVTYKIRDSSGETIKGGFYEEELQKTKYPETYLVEKIVRRKGNEVLVKWFGFDNKHNTWEKASNIEE